LLGPAGFGLATLRSTPPPRPTPPPPGGAEPLPISRLPPPVGRAATVEELGLLQGLEGKSQQQVLRLLGPPPRTYFGITKHDTEEKSRREGREVWEYDWGGRLFVSLRRGVVEWVSYVGPESAAIAQLPCD